MRPDRDKAGPLAKTVMAYTNNAGRDATVYETAIIVGLLKREVFYAISMAKRAQRAERRGMRKHWRAGI